MSFAVIFLLKFSVRDVARKAIGDADDVRASQRKFVQAVVSIYGVTDHCMVKYLSLVLQVHMTEAILSDPMEDELAQSWLDYSDEGAVHCRNGSFVLRVSDFCCATQSLMISS